MNGSEPEPVETVPLVPAFWMSACFDPAFVHI